MTRLTVLELCAGAGGQALGLERAGFHHETAIDIDPEACATLRMNRPEWRVLEADISEVNGASYAGVDLLAAGVPCPPFSIAGKQLGRDDERDLFPEALRLVREARPAAVLLENVRGFSGAKFAPYRAHLQSALGRLGYQSSWRLLNASDYGVPQLRPRFVLVALRKVYAPRFQWPCAAGEPPTVGATIGDLIAGRGWIGAPAWISAAQGIAPTIVGGSKKHGGPDLGPTRARADWRSFRVDGKSIAEEAPPLDFPVDGFPRLTLRMVARLQGFPDSWKFAGRKTSAYRQVGNAFPPPVAEAVGRSIKAALLGEETDQPRTGTQLVLGGSFAEAL